VAVARTRRGDAAKNRPITGSSRPASRKGRRRATPTSERNSIRGGSAAGWGAQVGEGTASARCHGRRLRGHCWAEGAGGVPTNRAAAATHGGARREEGRRKRARRRGTPSRGSVHMKRVYRQTAEPRKSPSSEEGREPSVKSTQPDEHNGGAAGGTAAESGGVHACGRSGWRGGRPAAPVPFVDTASLTRARFSLLWLQRSAAGRSVGALVGRPNPPTSPSGYPSEPKSERWRFASPLSTPHTHARDPVLPGGRWAVRCTRRPTPPRPPASNPRPPTQARAGCRVQLGVRRACPGLNLASLATPQGRKEPWIGRFSAGAARLPPSVCSTTVIN